MGASPRTPPIALPRRVQGHEHLYPEREKKERGRQSKLNSPSSNSQDNQKTQVKKQVQYRPQGLALETKKKWNVLNNDRDRVCLKKGKKAEQEDAEQSL